MSKLREAIKRICNKNHSTCFFDRITIKGVTYDWSECAINHDKDYSTSNVGITRLEADRKLYNCVKEKSKAIASIMFIGVRLFGKLYWKD